MHIQDEVVALTKSQENLASTVQSLYNAIYGVLRNGPCYQQIVLQRANFTNELQGNDHEMVIFL